MHVFILVTSYSALGLDEMPNACGIASCVCWFVFNVNFFFQISYAPRRDRYIATEVLKGGAVRDYYLATNIRIVLQEFFTPSDFNRASADRRKFYFTLRDVDVQVACFCNGMSNQCSPQVLLYILLSIIYFYFSRKIVFLN